MNNRFDKISNEEFINVFNNSTNRSDIVKHFNLPENGTTRRFINSKIKELNLDMSILHKNCFEKYHIKKVCPVCGKEFYVPTTKKASNKVCCSYACSNKYFRSGENNGMYKAEPNYTRLCFRYHPHKCCVCGEEHIVAVHHYDGNHNNNKISNLIPLCPTHHCYWHSNFRKLIKDKVDKYVKNFIKKHK